MTSNFPQREVLPPSSRGYASTGNMHMGFFVILLLFLLFLNRKLYQCIDLYKKKIHIDFVINFLSGVKQGQAV